MKTILEEKPHTGLLGATYLGNGKTHFRVWAPYCEDVKVTVVHPWRRTFPLASSDGGHYFSGVIDAAPGTRYFYRLDDMKDRPDPASRYQPEGVHGPTEVVVSDFEFPEKSWPQKTFSEYIIYELHVGTFTPDGHLDALLPCVDYLRDLGVTAVELMPVNQFSGRRNWGYDGVGPFAVHNGYGGPRALKRFVHACHQKGLAVILDVVYNHLGPEGNYLREFGPYFTQRYRTPWGSAVNFDGPASDHVRHFFIQNALYWIKDVHIDALRLDALHAICDFSARTFLEDLTAEVKRSAGELGRNVYVIGETDRNDARLLRPQAEGGIGLDAQWNDDFHHALHAVLTGENAGYYGDFGRLDQLAKAWTNGYVYTGQFSAFRNRKYGTESAGLPAERFVVFGQNHDQVGNRMMGERLSVLVSFEALKLAAAVTLLSPCVPLVFMGEEYGERAPFLYFTDHSDAGLIKSVREGRKREFEAFAWQGEVPDPQREDTFLRSKMNRENRDARQEKLAAFYKMLIGFRKSNPALRSLHKDAMELTCAEDQDVLTIKRWSGNQSVIILFHFGKALREVARKMPAGKWTKEFDSADEQWGGPGSATAGEVDARRVCRLRLLPESALVLSLEGDS